MLRVVLVALAVMSGSARAEHTIYLERHGAWLRPGIDDARAQTSSLIAQPVQTAAWGASDADWAATMDCMTELFAPFAVTITDRDPGAVPHVEALFGGTPVDLGLATNLSGIAPFASDCSVLENSIVFTFTDKLPHDLRRICEVMAQEIGHSYGLDHELLASDPMSQLASAQPRAFQDVDAACGETTPRPCSSGCRSTQNSVAVLTARLGASGDRDLGTQQIDVAAESSTGCSSGGTSKLGIAVVLFVLRRRRTYS